MSASAHGCQYAWGKISTSYQVRPSRRGEFRLVPLPGGGTRLEGRTWYEVEIFPQAYWQPWAEALIHRIHHRVLQHVKTLSES